jgi:hypothetical protein
MFPAFFIMVKKKFCFRIFVKTQACKNRRHYEKFCLQNLQEG